MPLSEHEQRIFDEIKEQLVAEDPKFARSANAATPRGVALGRIKRGVAFFALGLGFLLTGLFISIVTDASMYLFVLGLAGFAVMLASVVTVTRAMKSVAHVSVQGTRAPTATWFDRMEERWRKRFEQGDGKQ